MGSLAPASPWIPDDDFLLKSAVEAGASLESLAKGAVKFSRSFTVSELQDRWLSILYDPVISAESSAKMIELERSSSSARPLKSPKSGVCKDNKNNTAEKRKSESVRSSYYAMRKRICSQPFESMDLSFLVAPLTDAFVGNGDEPFSGNCIPGDPFSEEILHVHVENPSPLGNLSAFGDMELPQDCLKFELNKDLNNVEYSPLPEMSMWKTGPAPALPLDAHLGDKGLCSGDSFHLPDDYDGTITQCVKTETGFDDFPVQNSSDDYLAELSNSLLNFTNEEELLVMNADGKDIIDKQYYDGLSSLLSISPNGDSQPPLTDTDKPLCEDDNKLPNNYDEQMNSDPKIEIPPSISGSDLEFPVLEEGLCVLNTEDPHIPCNVDEDFLPNMPSGAEERSEATNKPVDQRITDREYSLIHPKKEVAGESYVQEIGPNATVSRPDLANNKTRVSGYRNGFPPEMLKDQASETLTEKHLNLTDCSQNKPGFGSESFKSHPLSNSMDIKVEHGVSVLAELKPMDTSIPELNLDTPAGNQDGASLENAEEIPYYSDVEAMILDMDLDPDHHNFNDSEEVSSYKQDNTKRMIIRLEQSVRAHMHRTIASHGALAVMYGHQSEHYIKKSEVLLGRATLVDSVDIDLGREGRINKISRKQAIIKMDKSGSFSLKNLNSHSIFVNGTEVGHKQSVNLNSGCLIEIRGLTFIFEKNETQVKLYLDNLQSTKKTRTGNKVSQRWSS